MSKPVVFALLGMALYALANLILEQKFSKFNNLTLMCVYILPILLVAIIGRQLTRTSDPSFDFPVGLDLAILVMMGLIFAAADYFYIGAYTSGGDLLTISCIVVMFPVFASLLKFAWTLALPNMWQMGGYVLAAGAVLLIAKGSTS